MNLPSAGKETWMISRFADGLIRFRWWVLGALSVVSVVAAVIAAQIDFDFTPQAIFAGQDDIVVYAENFKETFGYEDAVLLVVLEAQGARDVLNRELLTWQGSTAAQLKKLPHVVDVQTVPTLKLARWHLLGAKRFTTAPLVQNFPVDAETEERVRATVARFRMIEGALVSEDRKFGSMIVYLEPGARDIQVMREVVRSVEQALEATPPPGGFAWRLGGLPALRVDIVNDLQADQLATLPLAAAVFLVVLALIFRCWSGTLLPLLAAGVGMAWTLALLVAGGQTFNIMSSVMPVLLLILGVADAVHFMSRYAEETELAGGQRLLAARRTVAHMVIPCFLTYSTTAIGFLSLMAAHSEVLQDFGWQSSVGTICLFVSTILVLGVLAPTLRAPKHHGEDGSDSRLARLTATIGRSVALHPYVTLSAAVLVLAGCLWGSRGLVINSHMVEMYDDGHDTIDTMRLVEDHLVGFLPLEISLAADDPDRFREPSVYRKVAAAEQFAASLEPVLFTASYVDLHQEIYAHSRNSEALREKLPTDDDVGRSRIRRTERICQQVAGTLNYHAFITADGRQARILLRVRDVGTRQTLALIDQLETKLRELFPAGDGVEFRLTGDAYLNAKAMDGFVRDLFASLLNASVVIFLLIAALFRSWRLGLIAIPPNVAPLVITLGYIGWRGYELNAGNVIVFAIGLGIAVDDTIHFISRFREEAARGGSVIDAIRRTHMATGRAIMITSLLIISGMAILLISDFVPTRRFGELTAITMTAALFGDLFVLPACLVLFWKGTPLAAVSTEGDSAQEPRAAALPSSPYQASSV